MTDIEEFYTPEIMIAYADARNRERGRKVLKWLRLQPEDDPDLLVGVHPDDNSLVGPSIYCGKRYKIRYAHPMILPFHTEEEGNVVFHVAEIEGTLDASGTQLLNVKCVICQIDNYSIKTTSKADKSIFRLCIDDEIEQID